MTLRIEDSKNKCSTSNMAKDFELNKEYFS